MLNSTEHEILILDKSHLINLLDELFIYRKFHCFCLSNQSFKFDFSYTLKHQRDFKVWAQTQLSMDSSFISTGPGLEQRRSLLQSLARPIFFPRVDDSHCDNIHSSLITVHCFDDGYVEKKPVAWKESCTCIENSMKAWIGAPTTTI